MMDQESLMAFDVPAKWANRISMTVQPNYVRIAFGEAAAGESKASGFHSAVMLPRQDAEALRDMLVKMLEPPVRDGNEPPESK